MADDKPKELKPINVNIGILGHIDSGKTSLCKALSTVVSTASMDKHPQSQERGITLDLGFSSFSIDAPEHFRSEGYNAIQVCMVDCPGHASLIRTVIGGAQIIDMCCLVIDANRGIQPQTAECLVVAEILANQLVIILNKVDMIDAAKRKKTLDKVIKQLRMTFEKTKFGANLPFACVAANPQDGSPAIGIVELTQTLASVLTVPKRDPSGPFMFSFDHAFPIKGQGTVITGTVLSGTVKPGLGIVVPALGEAGKGKKVRSLQMFKQPVQEAQQGDRVAMCVAALDSKELERGIVISDKYPVPTLDAVICVVNRLTYFKQGVPTKAKFHVTLGHSTVMATAHFFCPYEGASAAGRSAIAVAEVEVAGSGAGPALEGFRSGKDKKGGGAAVYGGPTLAMGCGALVADKQKGWPTSFDFSKTYLHLDELFQHGAPIVYENNDGDSISLAVGPPGELLYSLNGLAKENVTELSFDPNSGRLLQQDAGPLASSADSRSVIPLKDRDRVIYLLRWICSANGVPGLPVPETEPLAYVLLMLEKPVTCPMGCLIIGSKLDFDIHTPTCRMAFFGRMLCSMDPNNLKPLRLLKMKSKVGLMDRFATNDRTTVICKDMFSADSDFSLFTGMKVVHEGSGMEGVIDGAYGKEGLFKVKFSSEVPLEEDAKGNFKGEERIALYFKKYNFEQSKKMIQ